MLYDKIKDLAEKRGTSIYRIEKDNDMSNGTISKWNDVQPLSNNLMKVANYLGVSMEELMSVKNEEN